MSTQTTLKRIESKLDKIAPSAEQKAGELVTVAWPTEPGEPKETITLFVTPDIEAKLAKIYGDDPQEEGGNR